MSNAFLNVGVSGGGVFPESNPGVAFFTLDLGHAQWDNGITPPFAVDQWVMNPNSTFLVSPDPTDPGFSLFMDPQNDGSISGDGLTYLYASASGYKRGTT